MESARKLLSEPDIIEDLSEYGQIQQVEFSSFEWSQDLLLVGFKDRILLFQLDLSEAIEVKMITEFSHPCRCTTLGFSSETVLNALPSRVLFCAGGNDFKLRVYDSDLVEDHSCIVLPGHSSYINDAKYDMENTYLASTSDDNTAKIWMDNKLKTTFDLTSPGINVCWHRGDTCKLLVAEKIGIIRFYNVDSEMPILSVDYSKPLSSAHWAPSDSEMIASLQLGELLIWDLTKPCLPMHNNIIFPENGGTIKFSPQAELIAAVNSLDSTLRVVHVKSQSPKLTASVTLPTNLSWHYRYPLICIGDDYKLCFWKVSAK